jgi:predicted PurR-regulated permease PerM
MTVMKDIHPLLKWPRLGLAIPIIALNLWILEKGFHALQPLGTVFILSALVAFLLNYPVKKLQQYGIQRPIAVILVSLIMLVSLGGLSITLLPILSEEFTKFTEALPQILATSLEKLQDLQQRTTATNTPFNFNYWLTRLITSLSNNLDFLSNRLVSIAIELFESISQLVLTIILSFYLLLDGERIWQGLFQRFNAPTVYKIQQELQQHFKHYFSGQIAIASILGSTITVIFLLLKVPFALVFGVIEAKLSPSAISPKRLL